MHKFVKIKRAFNGFSIEYDYLLLVDNTVSFSDYLMHTAEQTGLDYLELKRKPQNGCHWSRVQEAIRLKLELTKGRKTILDDLSIANSVFVETATKLYAQYGAFVVNSNGGMFPLDGKCEILETVESEKLVWPFGRLKTEDRIKITQWPNGTHWYARVDGEDVVMDNEQKWNTYKEAYDKAIQYIQLYSKN